MIQTNPRSYPDQDYIEVIYHKKIREQTLQRQTYDKDNPVFRYK